MDPPTNILLASKEQLDYLDKILVYQTQENIRAETILEQVSNSGQPQLRHVGIQGPGEVIILTSRRRNALIFVFALEST